MRPQTCASSGVLPSLAARSGGAVERTQGSHIWWRPAAVDATLYCRTRTRIIACKTQRVEAAASLGLGWWHRSGRVVPRPTSASTDDLLEQTAC